MLSTSQMVKYVEAHPEKQRFAILTECGLVVRLELEHPEKQFYKPCRLCQYMKATDLENVYDTLRDEPADQRITVPEEVRAGRRARDAEDDRARRRTAPLARRAPIAVVVAVATSAPATAAVQPGEERGISKTVSARAPRRVRSLTVDPAASRWSAAACARRCRSGSGGAAARAERVDVDDSGHVIATSATAATRTMPSPSTIAELNARLDDVAAEAAAAAQLEGPKSRRGRADAGAAPRPGPRSRPTRAWRPSPRWRL